MDDDKIVTDHALLRWLERVHGIDMEKFRCDLDVIVRDAVRAGAKALNRDGFKYVIENGKLVTVLTPEKWERKPGPRSKFRPRDFREAAE